MSNIHRFFCLKCGKEGLPLPRKVGHQHKRLHYKKLYCPWCKEEVNHVECRSDEDVTEFLENFKNGVYIEDAENSLSHCRSARLW